MITLALLLACEKPPAEAQPVDTDTTTPTSDPTEPPWGVASSCSGEEAGGFGPFYADGTAILVYGESPEDLALAQQVQIWYAESFDDLQLRRASELTEAERAEDLWILGTPATNGIFAELDGELAVRFEDGRFEFGGYEYAEPGHGIAILSPSPFAADRWVIVFGGNTLAGAESLFTIYTGGYDYVTTRGRGFVQQEGDLCHDDWKWFKKYGDDLRKPWDAYVGGLQVIATDHHVFLFEAGSDADQESGWLPAWQEDQYAHALDVLDVAPLDFPIRTYLYTTRDQKAEWTGNSGNAQANDYNYEVHALYGEGVHAVGAHEDVHVIARYRIGEASTALMGEGLAVWVDGAWAGQPLGYWASAFRASGELPPLADLVSDFWGHDDLTTYPLAGHFLGFLADAYGIDATKRIYAAPDLESGLTLETGLSLGEVEAAWLATIP